MRLNGEVPSELITALSADLTAARFTVGALTSLWGTDAAAALHRNQRVPALRAIAVRAAAAGASTTATNPGALATLARMFVLGLPVPVLQLAEALPQLGAAGAESLGLVTVTATGEAIPALDLRPYSYTDSRGVGSWWIASDLGELALGGAIPERHVLGVGGASLTLSGLMIPNQVDSVLDLGTGCGIQALHASRHARRVVATDISERALELAAFNAELNGITSIKFRLGSLFEPVAGERFDHIISNPPFVITPRTAGVPSYEYRDGGLEGDAIVESVIRGVEAHLNPGGVAQLLGNWEYRDGAGGLDRVNGWLDEREPGERGLDAWVIEREVQSVTEYAETWIRDGGTVAGSAEFDALYGAWLDDFERRGVSRVGFGYITLGRPASGAPTLRRIEQLVGAVGANDSGLGPHLAATLSASRWVARLDDSSLARTILEVAGDVTQESHYWPGDEDPSAITLHQGGGLARSVAAGTVLAAVVGACDGELSVAAIGGAIAQILEVDEDELLAEVLPSVRELIITGMLSPVSHPVPTALPPSVEAVL
jgi:SAM-dependent methyltransferase